MLGIYICDDDQVAAQRAGGSTEGSSSAGRAERRLALQAGGASGRGSLQALHADTRQGPTTLDLHLQLAAAEPPP